MMFKNKKDETADKPEEKKDPSIVVAKPEAMEELERIDEFFDAEYEESNNLVLLPHIMAGKLHLDENQKKVIYQLLKPIELANGDTLSELKLSALDLDGIIKVGKSLPPLKGRQDGSFDIPVSYDYERTVKTLTKCSTQPLGVLNRLKKRDINILKELLDFLQ